MGYCNLIVLKVGSKPQILVIISELVGQTGGGRTILFWVTVLWFSYLRDRDTSRF